MSNSNSLPYTPFDLEKMKLKIIRHSDKDIEIDKRLSVLEEKLDRLERSSSANSTLSQLGFIIITQGDIDNGFKYTQNSYNRLVNQNNRLGSSGRR